MLEREAEQHASVARDRLDVVPGLAAVNEDFARPAVGIETDGDREQLVPEPQVEGLCGPAPGKDIESIARDAGVLLSLALQHGVSPEIIRHDVTRGASEEPASILGAVVDSITTKSFSGDV